MSKILDLSTPKIYLMLLAFLSVSTYVSYHAILFHDSDSNIIAYNSFAAPREERMHNNVEEDENDDDERQKEDNMFAKKEAIFARERTIRIRDFVPTPVPTAVLKESNQRQPQIDFEGIATTWKLPAKETSIQLLKDIQSRPVGFDYNQTTDILSLRHPLKTGGTSISWMMLKIWGERVVPGSGPSNWWQRDKFRKAVKKTHRGNSTYWNNMRVLYTHSLLRESKGGRKNKLLWDLRRSVPEFKKKRFRLLTIVRRPLDLAASSYYETQCRIGRFANQRSLKGKACPPVNLTDVMHKNIDFYTNKCDEEGWKSKQCQQIKEQGAETFFGHCGSIDKMLEQRKVHNMMHRSMMGDFPRPPDEKWDQSNGINLTPTLEDVSLYTLRDLGGLIDYHERHKEDFVWFAITERFKESMCLFYYYFEVEPVEERKSLVKPCRPLTFWEERQKQKHIENEDFDYTVWRAANAIMDVRIADMKLAIKARIEAGEKLEDMKYVGPGCYA